MNTSTFPGAGARPRSVVALLAFATLLAGLAGLMGSAGQAAAAPGKAAYLGAISAKRIPLCPERCQGVAIVSGIQGKAGGKANAYKVPFNGEITLWRLTLGNPNMEQLQFFRKNFGNQPQASLGVLTRNTGGKPGYRLKYRTRIQGLNRFLGKTATFKLPKPLRVNKGDYVALIVPTWAPALSVPPACEEVNGKPVRPAICKKYQAGNSWVASRKLSQCEDSSGKPMPINPSTSQPQLKVNSIMPYQCRFNGVLTYGVRIESL